MKPLAGMKTEDVTVTFTDAYYAEFEAHCKKQNMTTQQMIGQLIALEMNPPNVVWGPWRPAA